jgi:hypothetical protein
LDRVATDEDEILGMSFLALRCITTMLHLPSLATSGGPEQMLPIDADDFGAPL